MQDIDLNSRIKLQRLIDLGRVFLLNSSCNTVFVLQDRSFVFFTAKPKRFNC